MSRSIETMLSLAADVATKRTDRRSYLVGALGIRSDGTIVHATNGPTETPNRCAHAEYRLSRKLDKGSEVFVARILRGGWQANAKPCHDCMMALWARRVSRIYYTIQIDEYGCIRCDS